MTDATWNLIEQFFARYPEARGTPVTEAEFGHEMINYMDLIPSAYRQFVLRFGGGAVGTYPIYGLRQAPYLGTHGGAATAPELNRMFRDEKWPGVEKWFVFSIDHGGNPIGFATDGSVWLSDQTFSGIVEKIENSFEGFILHHCFRYANEADANAPSRKNNGPIN